MASPGKRILIIVENLPLPFDKRVWNEANSLTRAGYGVSIICPKGKGYEDNFQELNGIRIYRHPMPREGNGLFGYMLEYGCALFWEFILSFKVLFGEGFDAIQACNPPDDIFIVGGFFKLFFGKKFVFDHHDLCPELYIAKFGGKSYLLYDLMKLAERLTFKTADISIATNRSYKEIAVARGKMKPENVFIVRSGPDVRKISPVEPDPSLKEGRLFMVGYVGVMGKQEGLDYLLRSVKCIVEKGREDILFVLIGSGPETENIRRQAIELGVDRHVRFTGRIPDDRLLRILSTCDVCVNPDAATEMNDKSTMNKIMEYMALGKPIVQFDLVEGRYSAQDASLYAAKNDPVDFAEKILTLLGNPEKRRAMGDFGRRRVLNELSWEHSEKELLRAYAALFGAASPERGIRTAKPGKVRA